MFSDSASCTVTDTDGSDLSFPDALGSPSPLTGLIPSMSFVIYVPTDGARHSLVLVFDGGFDAVA